VLPRTAEKEMNPLGPGELLELGRFLAFIFNAKIKERGTKVRLGLKTTSNAVK
jgi:hypothetical protein